jgi:hypothetical protein
MSSLHFSLNVIKWESESCTKEGCIKCSNWVNKSKITKCNPQLLPKRIVICSKSSIHYNCSKNISVTSLEKCLITTYNFFFLFFSFTFFGHNSWISIKETSIVSSGKRRETTINYLTCHNKFKGCSE